MFLRRLPGSVSLSLAALALALAGCHGSDDTTGLDPSSLDESVDPCTDFFQYACGGFIAKNPVGDTGAAIARRTSAYFATEKVEVAVLTEAINTPQGAEEVALGAYASACLGAGASESRPELDAVLAQIDAVAGPDDVARAVAALHALGADALFAFGSTRNLVTPGARLAFAGQGGLGLPDRSYYLDQTMDVITPYRAHISTLAGLAHVDDPGMPDAVIRIETALATATVAPDQLRDPASYFHLTDRAAFEATVPDFSWAAYRTAVGAPAFSSLDVETPTFFAGLEGALKSAPLTDLRSYLRWRALEAFAWSLDDDVVAEQYAFHDGVFYGFTTPLPRPEYCLRLTGAALPWAMSRAYVARAFSAATGDAARSLMESIRGALHDDLATATFLDAPTRMAAIAKLDAVHVAVGAPDTWPSLGGLSIPAVPFTSAYAAVARFDFQTDVARIGSSATDDWFMPPNQVNAAYSPARNAVDFPAAILQAPLFDPTYARAVQFGAMGAIMGHELTHGFDDDGRHFDGAGKLTDWWTAQTAKAFQDRAQCLVDQYDAIDATPGVKIDGALTLGENIADLGGVKLAYDALAPAGGDARTFFLAYAQSRCENDQPAYLATLARTDPHAPSRARVNAVLANMPELADTFSCGAGTPMAPAKRCSVW
jgi:endothelin-converting enzyme/putative endopeptidase